MSDSRTADAAGAPRAALEAERRTIDRLDEEMIRQAWSISDPGR